MNRPLGIGWILMFAALGSGLAGAGTARGTSRSTEAPAEVELQQALEEQIEELERAIAALRERLAAAEEILAAEQAAKEDLEILLEENIAEDREVEETVGLLPDLTGYFDFEYRNDSRTGSPGSFRQHRLTLMPSVEHGDFRVFSEIEFEYGTLLESGGEGELSTARGNILVEQAWAEYLQADYLSVRGGVVLTPGYWNVKHYANVVPSTRKPLMVGKVYPKSFAGIMAYGSLYASRVGLTYQAYLGNGESADFARVDNDENKAVGGRLVLHTLADRIAERLDLVISGYGENLSQDNETTVWGVEAQIEVGPLQILSEFARRVGDGPRRGVYIQPSLGSQQRLAVFYRYDLFRNDPADRVEEHTVGLHIHPHPMVVLKTEAYRSNRSSDDDFNGVAASIAVAF